jgi:hypothetical protein
MHMHMHMHMHMGKKQRGGNCMYIGNRAWDRKPS